MRKLFIIPAIAALVVSPFGVQKKAFGMEDESQYSNLTETQSFYRVTRGFVSPLSELDNNVDTKIEFSKGKYLTYLDYIFVDDIYVESIKFKSDDTVAYQRIVLMENSIIRQQFDLYKYPDGVIPVNFSTQKIDTVKLQFNGAEGTQHTLAELEIVGTKADTAGGSAPSGDSTLVTPALIAQLIQDEDDADTGSGGDGEPVITEPLIEDGGSNNEPGTGEPADSDEAPAVEDDGSDVISNTGDPIITESPVEDDGGNVGDGSSEGTPLEESTEEDYDGIGDTDYIDNGEEEAEPTQPEDGGAVVPGTPDTPDESDGSVIDPIEESVSPGKDVLATIAMPLTPSVFKNKHTYKVYRVNAASLKLMNHKHYDEAFLKTKLANSYVWMDEEYLTINEFISVLKEQDADQEKPSKGKK